jgi:SAM-dependent methyltransferase
MDTYFETNLKHWDELVGVHKETPYYDLAGFKAGRDSVHSTEVGELGDVAGKTLLHLQCHFGMDTLSWARRGAIVTGVDFSQRAIESARALATELGIDARFVHSDIYSLPDNLAGQFDVVFTCYGTNFWLPDLDRWAAVIGDGAAGCRLAPRFPARVPVHGRAVVSVHGARRRRLLAANEARRLDPADVLDSGDEARLVAIAGGR